MSNLQKLESLFIEGTGSIWQLLEIETDAIAQLVRNYTHLYPELCSKLYSKLDRFYASLEHISMRKDIINSDSKTQLAGEILNTLPTSCDRIIWFANSLNINQPARCSHMRSVGATLIPAILSGKNVLYVLCALPCGGIGSPEGNASNTRLPSSSEMKTLLSENIGPAGKLIDTSYCDAWIDDTSLKGRIRRIIKIIDYIQPTRKDCIIHQGCILGSTLPMHLLSRRTYAKQYLHMMCYDNNIQAVPSNITILSPSPALTNKITSNPGFKTICSRPSVNMIGLYSKNSAGPCDLNHNNVLQWLETKKETPLLISCGAHLQSRISIEWINQLREAACRLDASVLLIGVTHGQSELTSLLTKTGIESNGLADESIKIVGWINNPRHLFALLSSRIVKSAYIFPGESGGGGHDQICALWARLPVYLYGAKDAVCSLPDDVFYENNNSVFHAIERHWSFPDERDQYIESGRNKLKLCLMNHLEYGYTLYAKLGKALPFN